MTAVLHNQGRYSWSGSRNEEGHREYKLVNLVRAHVADGPEVIMATPGLPLVGSYWNFGNGYDSWAFCKPDMTVTLYDPPAQGDPSNSDNDAFWEVGQTFSTQPRTRCQDESIEDPLLEPQKVSGSFVKYLEEAIYDYNGDPILSSSYERLRGSAMEFDANRPTVRVEQNVASLGLATFSSMVDTVNGSALWGLGTRRIKLSNVSWERRLHGICDYYYTRIFDFDIRYDTFDRGIQDEGWKALGRIVPDSTPPTWEVPTGWVKTNKLHFTAYQDANGNPARVLLDSNGEPATTTDATTVTVQYYGESNFLLLGIPTVF